MQRAPRDPSASVPRSPIALLSAAFLLSGAPGCVEPEPDPEPQVEPPPCGRADLALAPPPREEAGVGTLVAVDFDRLELDATVDAASERLDVRARASFSAGAWEGRSVIQLGRRPAELWLDDEALDPEALELVVVSEPPRALTLLPDPLAPCSEHTLEVAYPVTFDEVEPAPLPRLQFDGGTAWWASAQEDGMPDSMLEVWAPSNLIFDRFELDLSVELVGAAGPHALAANDDVVDEGGGRWSVSFGRRQPHGPFWVLYPSDGVSTLERPVTLPDGRVVTVDARAFEDDAGVSLPEVADRAEQALLLYDDRLGPYLHGDRYLAWMRSGMEVSMEYEGATLSSQGALEHEMAHSWYARGIAPVSDHHGWLDEGVALWATGANPFLEAPVPVGTAGARLLVGEDDWSGASLGGQHYVQGAVVFAGIADRVGIDSLLASMRGFYGRFAPGPIATVDLERWLYCDLDDPYVLDIFHNKVRGLDGYAPDPPDGWCDPL